MTEIKGLADLSPTLIGWCLDMAQAEDIELRHRMAASSAAIHIAHLTGELNQLQQELAEIRLLAKGRGRGRDKATLESIERSVTRAIGADDPPSMGGWGTYKSLFHPEDDDPGKPDASKLPYHIEQVLLADERDRPKLSVPLDVRQRMQIMQRVTPEQMRRAEKSRRRTLKRMAINCGAVPEGVLS